MNLEIHTSHSNSSKEDSSSNTSSVEKVMQGLNVQIQAGHHGVETLAEYSDVLSDFIQLSAKTIEPQLLEEKYANYPVNEDSVEEILFKDMLSSYVTVLEEQDRDGVATPETWGQYVRYVCDYQRAAMETNDLE